MIGNGALWLAHHTICFLKLLGSSSSPIELIYAFPLYNIVLHGYEKLCKCIFLHLYKAHLYKLTWNVSYMGIFIKKLWQYFTPCCKALKGQALQASRPCFAPPHKALIHIKPMPLGFYLTRNSQNWNKLGCELCSIGWIQTIFLPNIRTCGLFY